MDQAVDMEVVEEPLNVKEKEACHMPRLDTCLDRVHHAQDRVGSSMVIPRPELPWGKELEVLQLFRFIKHLRS